MFNKQKKKSEKKPGSEGRKKLIFGRSLEFNSRAPREHFCVQQKNGAGKSRVARGNPSIEMVSKWRQGYSSS